MDAQTIAVMIIAGACAVYLFKKYRRSGKTPVGGACACKCDSCGAACPTVRMRLEKSREKA